MDNIALNILFSNTSSANINDIDLESEESLIETLGDSDNVINPNVLQSQEALESIPNELVKLRDEMSDTLDDDGSFMSNIQKNAINLVNDSAINLVGVNAILSQAGVDSNTTIQEVIDMYENNIVFASEMDADIERVISYMHDDITNFDQVLDSLIENAEVVLGEGNVNNLSDIWNGAITKAIAGITNAKTIAIINNIGENLNIQDVNEIAEKAFSGKNANNNIIKNTANFVDRIQRRLLKDAKGIQATVDLMLPPGVVNEIKALDRIADNFTNMAEPAVLSPAQAKLLADNETIFNVALGNAMRITSDALTMKVGNTPWNKKQIREQKARITAPPKDGGLHKNRSLLGPLGKLGSGILGSKNIKPEYLARILTAYQFDNPIYQILGQGIQDGLNVSAKVSQDFYSQLHKGLEGINLSELSGVVSNIGGKRTVEVTIGGKNIRISPMELFELHMILQQEEGRTHVVDRYDAQGNKLTHKKGFAVAKSQFIDKDQDKNVVDTFFTGGLHPNEVIGIDAKFNENSDLVKIKELWYSMNNAEGTGMTDRLNAASIKTIGTEIAPENPKYYPLEVKQFGKDVGRGLKVSNVSDLENQGQHQKRVSSTEPLVLRDGLHRMVNTIKGNSNYIGMARPVRQVATILNDKNFREDLIQRGYKNELDAYTNILHNATNVIQQSDAGRFIQKVNTVAATGILSLNIPVVMLQNMSSLLYPTVFDNSAYISKGFLPEQTLRSVKNLLQFGGALITPKELQNSLIFNFEEAMKESPIFWQRVMEGNVSPELTSSTEESIKTTVAGKRFTIKSWLNTPIKKSDMIALLDGWSLAKREVSNFAENKIDGLTKPSAKQWYQSWESMNKPVPTVEDVANQTPIYWDMVNARSQYVWAATQPSFNGFERTSNNSDKTGLKSIFFAFRSYWDTVTSIVSDTVKRHKYDSKQFGDGLAIRNLIKNLLSIYIGLALASLLKDIMGNLVGRTKKEPEEILFNAMMPLFNIVPIVGSIAQSLTLEIITGKKPKPWTWDIGVPSLDYLLNLGRDTHTQIGKWDEDTTEEEKWEIILKIIHNGIKSVGINFQDVISSYDKLTKEDESSLGRGRGRTARSRTARGRTSKGRTSKGRTARGRTARGRASKGRTSRGRR